MIFDLVVLPVGVPNTRNSSKINVCVAFRGCISRTEIVDHNDLQKEKTKFLLTGYRKVGVWVIFRSS